jgi:hypothetical protein
MTRRPRPPWRTGTLLAALLAASGCSHGSNPPAAAAPATLHQGAAALARGVTLTALAATRLGVETGRVEQAGSASPGGPALTSIPISALIYDPEGGAWTYTLSAPDTFVRAPLVIDHVDGALVYLRSGPAAGTPVVTVGAPELLGSEYGVGAE